MLGRAYSVAGKVVRGDGLGASDRFSDRQPGRHRPGPAPATASMPFMLKSRAEPHRARPEHWLPPYPAEARPRTPCRRRTSLIPWATFTTRNWRSHSSRSCARNRSFPSLPDLRDQIARDILAGPTAIRKLALPKGVAGVRRQRVPRPISSGDERPTLINTPLQRVRVACEQAPQPLQAVLPWWVTAEAVPTPRPSPTPRLKRGVNEDMPCCRHEAICGRPGFAG